ncbi:50S ribosomal protein L21 [Dissulfurispira thermophila]|uniref:Large ribosomal subunit protein bL21 n=1 Tax=Dissulfurispira thermophila TaxID=2715679 RepID=A0A7G1H098_9BACT|nr:50S ribosomal protein L21 [Dissulfurispira thermophila]BCB96124.1 50S ribosomal protein L21 [Dissulfurispira thermophila]
MYAIIQAGGEQVRVSAGDKICVEKIKGDVQSEVLLDKVLVVSKDDKIVFGRPYVNGASVKAEIVETGRMPKVLVFGPRPKKAHRKLKGHRQQYTTLKIKEIIA